MTTTAVKGRKSTECRNTFHHMCNGYTSHRLSAGRCGCDCHVKATPTKPKRPRLTPHQKEVYDRLVRLSFRRDGNRSVAEKDIGSYSALYHLKAKGYITIARTEYGPRGGEYRFWEPTDA